MRDFEVILIFLVGVATTVYVYVALRLRRNGEIKNKVVFNPNVNLERPMVIPSLEELAKNTQLVFKCPKCKNLSGVVPLIDHGNNDKVSYITKCCRVEVDVRK